MWRSSAVLCEIDLFPPDKWIFSNREPTFDMADALEQNIQIGESVCVFEVVNIFVYYTTDWLLTSITDEMESHAQLFYIRQNVHSFAPFNVFTNIPDNFFWGVGFQLQLTDVIKKRNQNCSKYE